MSTDKGSKGNDLQSKKLKAAKQRKEMDESLQGLIGDLMSEQSAKYGSTEVGKAVEPKTDLACLALFDQEPLALGKEPEMLEERLKNLARDNCQLLLNRVWDLPTERVDGVLCAALPKSLGRLPREKPIPKAKPASKWEEYRKAKGLNTAKKSGKVWDELSQSWKARYGYKRARDDTKDWVIEVPEGADPNRDMFGERRAAKKERVAKNELQRIRNLARAEKASQPTLPAGLGGRDPKTRERKEVEAAVDRARSATASLGKFTTRVSKAEKTPKVRGAKRNFAPNETGVAEERARGLDILAKMAKRGPVLNTTGVAASAADMLSSEKREKRDKAQAKGRRSKAGVKRRAGPHSAAANSVTKSKAKRGNKAPPKGAAKGGPKGKSGKGKAGKK